MRDPVATANAGILRFESFSQCNGVYARLDFPLDEWSSDLQRDVGTTNVDFNDEMIRALSVVRRDRLMILSVGEEAVAVETLDGAVVERRVPLSERWVRGFGEAAVGLSELRLVMELSQPSLRALLRDLPKSRVRSQLYLTNHGREARLTTQPSTGMAAIGSPERLTLIEPLVRYVRRCQIYGSERAGSLVVFDLELADDGGTRFQLALSPEAYRGFSGEGNLLHALTDVPAATVQSVRDVLCWQPSLDVIGIASGLGLDVPTVRMAMASLAAVGLVGFDVHRESYFHRELPFQLDDAHRLHPRLRSAEKAIAAERVMRVNSDAPVAEFLVGHPGQEQLVRLWESHASCTCTWWFRYRGDRGPCKHVTAARLLSGVEGVAGQST